MAKKYYIKINKKNGGFIIFEELELETLKNKLEYYLLDNYPEIEIIPQLEKSTWAAFKKYYENRILIK